MSINYRVIGLNVTTLCPFHIFFQIQLLYFLKLKKTEYNEKFKLIHYYYIMLYLEDITKKSMKLIKKCRR